MTERDPKIMLSNDKTRCSPYANPCPEKHTCARALAPFPNGMGSNSDFTITLTAGAKCVHYISASSARAEASINHGKPAREHVKGLT